MDQVLLIGTVAAAFLFAFVNGWHDGFNVVATSVLSRSMSPARALFLASAAAVAGALILGTAVAKTLGSELIHAGLSGPGEMVPLVLIALSAVISALTWNLMTWAMGHSPSSSHALVGGLLGGALAARGLGVVVWKTLSWKILAVLLIAPPLGTLLGQWALSLSRRVLRRSPPSGREFFTRRQSLGLVFLSAGHGANDAQKAMGIITMALVSSGSIPGFSVPLWVVLGCGGALAAGIFVGGCKIVKV
ncbi:MAG: inorganic phosphate transporter, partial [Deltaproteobacteria bacterium]|nr:inorganic phosphate transporter [Deltaproteobacteria bacterium]